MATDDLKSQALNSSQDFYALLEVNEGASESEIRRAYRKTALKYHPDKVGANQEALDKFHLLQIAYDVLCDQSVKELYDNARRARQAKAERDKAYDGRRKWMKEDLERRESGVFKRKREEVDAEEEFERELRRLAEDGKRRRKEREEMLRKEANEMQDQEQKDEDGEVDAKATANGNGEVDEIDRSITLRFPQNESTRHLDEAKLVRIFERFGPIEEVIVREKKIKIDGQKHRQPYVTAVLAFKSVVGAHAAVTDFPQAAKSDPEVFGVFEAVSWAATPAQNGNNKTSDGLRKVPSFGSFKDTPAKGAGSPSLDEITMIRLKNAQRRRMEEKIRRDEAEAEKMEDPGEDGADAK